MVVGYHRAAAEAITWFGGHVAKYPSDGVMAYVGWLEAHENDANRAPAQAWPSSKECQNSTKPKLSVTVRIGSGGVVVGASNGNDADAFGEAPNFAAPVQTAAAPDTIL